MALMGLFDKFRKDQPDEEEHAATYPEGARMYCIGDIHGRADLLDRLHLKILKDSRGYKGEKHLLYLGDYIDRGEQSRQVIEMLVDDPLPGFECIFLKGNHEQAMLDFLVHPRSTASWLNFGGRQTLASYGIAVSFMPLMKDLKHLAEELNERLPESHKQFLEDGLLSWRSGDYYFVHAGIRPGVALEDQHFEDQLWIREDFTQSTADHGAVIVHGHTISKEAELCKNRIGIDTGAFHSEVLTCLVLEGTDQRLLQTEMSIS